MSGPTLHQLLLDGLHERHWGLTPAVANSYSEAARVCLGRHHTSPVEFTIEGERTMRAQVSWTSPGQRERDAWNNQLDATRDGAYAMAVAAAELALGLTTISRAREQTGSDYLVVTAEPDTEIGTTDFESALRLEVSGVDRGGPPVVAARLRRKLAQLERAAPDEPGFAAVVGFEAKLIQIVRLESQ